MWFQLLKLTESRIVYFQWSFILTTLTFTVFVVLHAALDQTLIVFSGLLQIVIIQIFLMFTQRGQLFKYFLGSVFVLFAVWIVVSIVLCY